MRHAQTRKPITRTILGVILCAAGFAAATPSIAADNGLITADFFKHYVDEFNQNDKETIVNHIPNASAWSWMSNNVPRFECPDKQMEKTYYFRWWTYRKHIRQSPDGFVLSEFLAPTGYKGNAVNCAAGHHIYEGRWIRDPQYLDGYTRFWFGNGGDAGGTSKHYSNWLNDAAYARYMVNGDKAFIISLLDNLIANHNAWRSDGPGDWAKNRRLGSGLYWQIDMWEGTEFSAGGSGARPLINSYMYGSAQAISRVAALAGRNDVAAQYQAEAEQLRTTIESQLWDPKGKFFNVKRDAPTEDPFYGNKWKEPCAQGQRVQTRELFGYVPWYFNLPENDKGYEEAWRQVTDPQGFRSAYGLTTCERRSRYYYVPDFETCMWNGSVWPYATSQALTALANVLNNYQQQVVGKQDYFAALQTYSRSQQRTLKNGAVVPWIDESLKPDTGEWITTNKDWGKDYNHSSFCDLIISGLAGLRPRADDILEVHPLAPDGVWDSFCLDNVLYHGKNLAIFWDRTGAKYGRGAGLHVWADGVEIAHSPTLTKIQVSLVPKRQR